MNPQITTTRPAGIDAQFLVATSRGPRVVGHDKPAVRFGNVRPIEDVTVGTPERDRQDSLAFLHKLVMG